MEETQAPTLFTVQADSAYNGTVAQIPPEYCLPPLDSPLPTLPIPLPHSLQIHIITMHTALVAECQWFTRLSLNQEVPGSRSKVDTGSTLVV